MPDVWTYAPHKLKKALIIAGAECETTPRVLKDRDPEWTCQINGTPHSYDIYIHHAAEFPGISHMILLCSALGIIAGLLWGRRFWQPPRKSVK